MGSHHEHPEEDRIYYLEEQRVAVDDFEAQGYVLDIGGGGEGIMGTLKGCQVIAIDRSRRELEEAAEGPLKIVMDATDLQFLDGTFQTATAFFALMFVSPADQASVMREVYRVLVPGGRFLVWDAALPTRLDEDKDIVAFHLSVRLPGEEIRTGYGTKWPEHELDPSYYARLATDAGFEPVERKEDGRMFFLYLRKPERLAV